ncbi:MAG: hypothetical protein ABF876_18155 [Acetobacter aceti]|uniref:Uncharacterized protein n=1 Tax=Acetobacter aceti TaxID=435 RepID=A0A1U9KEV8_ACEAC|nr:hypothetical protein [Acetobacter aceti]AQS84343.1 hypothetical protein A0U92_05655 [Acetobacter aceti]
MADEATIFEPVPKKEPAKRPVRKLPTFTPFIFAAAFLVIVWGVLTFVFPHKYVDFPASTILKNTLQPASSASTGNDPHQ